MIPEIKGAVSARPKVRADINSVRIVTAGGEAKLQQKSVTPSEQQQNVFPDLGYDGLSKVSVGAIPADYVGPEVPEKAAATYYPSTSDQTITAEQYLAGAQTLKKVGSNNLSAANIRDGVTVRVGAGDTLPEIVAHNVFTVAGTFTHIAGSDAAAPADVRSGKKFFVNGNEYTGAYEAESLHIGTAQATSANSSTLVFTGLAAEPEIFFVTIDPAYNDRRTTAVMYDGTTVYNSKGNRIYSAMTASFSNGTLTITGGTSDFDATYTYTLTYAYVA